MAAPGLRRTDQLQSLSGFLQVVTRAILTGVFGASYRFLITGEISQRMSVLLLGQFWWVLLVLLLGACIAVTLLPPPQIRKSLRDTREYRAMTLDNGLKIVPVPDSTTEKDTASVEVDAGTVSVAAEFLGLAHLLEYMLFLGTAPFPQAREFQTFISSHGGGHHAYTVYELSRLAD